MLHRRLTTLLLTVPVVAALTSCGFDYPTDRVNNIAAGVNDRDASVDVLGIRVLAFADGEGRLIGALANNLTEEPAELTSVTAEDGVATFDFEPVEIGPNAGINLADDSYVIPATGDFAAGEFIDLEFTFDTGETVGVNAPVVKPCFQYEDIPAPESDATAAEDGATEATESTESTESTEDESHSDATYTCEHESATGEEGEH